VSVFPGGEACPGGAATPGRHSDPWAARSFPSWLLALSRRPALPWRCGGRRAPRSSGLRPPRCGISLQRGRPFPTQLPWLKHGPPHRRTAFPGVPLPAGILPSRARPPRQRSPFPGAPFPDVVRPRWLYSMRAGKKMTEADMCVPNVILCKDRFGGLVLDSAAGANNEI
jgi:hypothetical protein